MVGLLCIATDSFNRPNKILFLSMLGCFIFLISLYQYSSEMNNFTNSRFFLENLEWRSKDFLLKKHYHSVGQEKGSGNEN